MAYISAADMRDGTLYPWIDVPSAGVGAMGSARLDAMGTAASARIDAYCHDNFGSSSGGTVLLRAHGGTILYLPRRVRAVSSVKCIDYAATSYSFDNTYWRIHTSLSDVSGSNIIQSSLGHDALELKKALTVGNAGGGWPVPPWTVEVVGDWGWAATPEAVKQAAAMIVWSWCMSNIPPGVESVSSGGLTLRRPTNRFPDTTGVLEADILLEPYRRMEFGAQAVV